MKYRLLIIENTTTGNRRSFPVPVDFVQPGDRVKLIGLIDRVYDDPRMAEEPIGEQS